MKTPDILPPPKVKNQHGETRAVGFEFEFGSLSPKQAASILQGVVGGEISAKSTFEFNVVSPELGKFTVEIDSAVLTKKKYKKPLEMIGVDLSALETDKIDQSLLHAFSLVVPVEISTPPIPFSKLKLVGELENTLRLKGAVGTGQSMFYAFGLHLNPETPSLDSNTLLRFLQAFLLLYPWIQERVEVDFTRKITPFISRFPDEYLRVALDPDYDPDSHTLITDYLRFNPTRNRPLDMLPILSMLDEKRVREIVGDDHKINSRPAFHYRMPNCLIDDENWSSLKEWNTWVAVERLAGDSELIVRMCTDFQVADRQSMKPFLDQWPAVLSKYMEELWGEDRL